MIRPSAEGKLKILSIGWESKMGDDNIVVFGDSACLHRAEAKPIYRRKKKMRGAFIL